MVLFFSSFSKLFQSWYYLLPSHALCYRTSCTSVLVYLIFLFDRGIYFLLKTLGIILNHIFQLNCGKFFWDMFSHEVSYFCCSCFFDYFWRVSVCTFLFITHLWMWKFFHDQLLVASWSLQEFSLWLVVGCMYEFSLPFVAIMSHQSSKQALQTFPQWRFLFYPLHQKPGSCKSGLWCSLKKLDSFEIDFQEFLGMAIAAFTLGLLPPHYRDNILLSTWPKRALLMFLVWLVGTGTMLTL